MMYSAYKLNKQGDNIQLWCTSFPVLIQSFLYLRFYLLLLDLHTYFSGARSGGLVVPFLSEFSSLLWSTVKGFGIVNKAEMDVFLNSLTFSMIQWMLAIWFLVSLPYLNPAWISEVHGSCTIETWLGEFWALLACEMSAIVQPFEHSLALLFFGIGMKTDLFQSCGHCLSFPNFLDMV